MSHREMVILTPQRGITVNREQMEAHLSLHGWQPIMVGMGGAEKFDGVIYTHNVKAPPWTSEFGDTGVRVAKQTLAQLNIKGKATFSDCWYMSDKYFWPLAHACVEADNQGKT